ncbi:MAG TPA: glycine oxidase ThiO [Candidatus Dormibacteraeota bacterium]|nr:glycine oxidase ThiO [Candidatus Dormibacteraeota bacterium]
MLKFDVAIAGAGLIGSAIALELARAGLHVGVFDRQEPGREASWASAGILSPAPENPGMIPMVPVGMASMALYPEFIANVEGISRRDTGYRKKGTMEALFSRNAREELSTLVALHHGLGLKAEALSADEAREMEPALSEDIEAAMFRPDEGAVDNRALTGAVLEAAKISGVEIFADKGVRAVSRAGNRCTGLLIQNETVEAEFTVVAGGCYSGEIEGVAPYAPVAPAKGQILALRHSDVKIGRVLWSENIYLVPRPDGRVIAGATVENAGFDKHLTAGGLQKLVNGATELAPQLASARVEEIWAGLRPDSPDHLPIIGPTDVDGLLIATGHFRSGIVLAPITAKLICEWITKKSVSLDWDRFSPMRFQQARKTADANK